MQQHSDRGALGGFKFEVLGQAKGWHPRRGARWETSARFSSRTPSGATLSNLFRWFSLRCNHRLLSASPPGL